MKIINARLRRQEALFTLDLQDGIIHRITAQAAMQTADAGAIDAQGRLAIRPSSSRISILTPPSPRVSRSGTAAAPCLKASPAGASAKRVLPRRTPASGR